MPSTTPPTIAELKDPEVFVALKRLCSFIVENPWQTSGDPEYDSAVAKTREYKSDVIMLSEIDLDVAWGQIKYKSQKWDGNYISKDAGDLNPWYEGELTLKELLDSIEPLADLIDSTTPQYLPEVEFLHYYNFLRSKLSSHTSKREN